MTDGTEVSRNISAAAEWPDGLMRMNECIERHAGGRGWERAFDDFWRRGEVAVMFGGPGTGKTILAVQIAEAIARGGDIPWFDIEVQPAPVLYVDLVMPEEHFARRYAYAYRSERTIRHRFSERLHRGRPPKGVELMEFIRSTVAATGAEYVIVDDADAVRRTGSGTLDTVRLMQELRELAAEKGVSVLVIASSREASVRTGPAESDLGPQAALCRYADSVFAIGRWYRRPETRYLVQTRSRNAAVRWTPSNAVGAKIEQDRGGMLGFAFEATPNEIECERICRINRMREEGKTFREIGTEMGLSKSHAQRLATRWRGWMEKRPEPAAARFDELAEGGGYAEEPECRAEERTGAWEPEELQPEPAPPVSGEGVQKTAEIAGPIRRGGEPYGPKAAPFHNDGTPEARAWAKYLIRRHPDKNAWDVLKQYREGEAWCRPPGAVPPYDPDDPLGAFEREYDHYTGAVSFVEKRDGQGRRMVWYSYRSDGCLRKWVRDGLGISGSQANPNFFGRAAQITPREAAEMRAAPPGRGGYVG